jgi:polysaccharide export outer membrane protein
VRRTAEGTQSYRIRLDDLLNDGDINANAPVRPGDVIIIPETFL